MLIDWFTVGAQAINFLILVWLMKRFLYQPILDAIDAREKRISAELTDAGAIRDAARKERDKFQHKNELFNRQRAALLTQATDEVKAERQRMLDEARATANDLRSKRQEALRREQQILTGEIARRTREEVFAISRQTLTDLAGASLEERMSNVFTRRVRELTGKEKDGFSDALRSSSLPSVVRSTFDLSAEQRDSIQLALNESFGADIRLSFETAPTVISGIELTANGHKVGWSIADYLTTLEKSVSELLQDKAATQVKPADKPEAKIE